jgi:hypothetical protein
MPWWKRTQKPGGMGIPDTRTERVIDRLEIVAERMEAVAKVLSADMDRADDEDRVLRGVIRDAQGGRPTRKRSSPSGGEYDASR